VVRIGSPQVAFTITRVDAGSNSSTVRTFRSR
jgi:hypothetical protein